MAAAARHARRIRGERRAAVRVARAVATTTRPFHRILRGANDTQTRVSRSSGGSAPFHGCTSQQTCNGGRDKVFRLKKHVAIDTTNDVYEFNTPMWCVRFRASVIIIIRTDNTRPRTDRKQVAGLTGARDCRRLPSMLRGCPPANVAVTGNRSLRPRRRRRRRVATSRTRIFPVPLPPPPTLPTPFPTRDNGKSAADVRTLHDRGYDTGMTPHRHSRTKHASCSTIYFVFWK